MSTPCSVTQVRAEQLLGDAWDFLRKTPFTAQQIDGRLTRLPDLGPDAVAARAAHARALFARIDVVDIGALPASMSIPLSQARYALRAQAHADEWYWLVIDPMEVGFYGLFLPTAYGGGFLLNFAFESLRRWPLEHADDLDGYLLFVDDMTRLIGQFRIRTEGQARRGILMPKPQIPGARALVEAFRVRTETIADVDDERFAAGTLPMSGAFRAEIKRRVAEQLQASFDELSAALGADYESAAPETVGLAQYPGGADVYDQLVHLHTTLDLTPAEVHAIGQERLHEIEAQARSLREEVGLLDPMSFLSHIEANPRYRATNDDEVMQAFMRYVDRMDLVYGKAFHHAPSSPFEVTPLPPAMQSGMTFGYYDPPKPGRPEGRFHFNTTHLTSTPLHGIASLTYHELVPGHHVHMSRQTADDKSHPISQYAFCNAFNEGWAEYAAILADELGCYEELEERYGRCMMDAFLTCRLIVDTGMNALGWSLEEARDFLRKHTAMSEAEIDSETLRYSCDIPAQSLAYKLGDTELLRLREAIRIQRAARGESLDVRDFHDAVLSCGAMPLPDLCHEVQRQLTPEGAA